VPKKAYINLFDNAHKCLRGEIMSPERVSTQCVILDRTKIIYRQRCQSRVKRAVDKTREVNNDNRISSPKATAINYLILPYYHLVGGREQHTEVLIFKQFIMSKVLGYETVFDTAGRTMTHKFHQRLSITLSFKDCEIIIVKDNEVVEKVNLADEPLSLSDYERILKMASDAVTQLNKFENGK